MNGDELVSELTSIARVSAHITDDGRVEVSVGGSVPRLVLDPDRILLSSIVDGPTGPAVELVVPGEPQPWYVTAGDVAYPPDLSALEGPFGITYTVQDLPPVVGWRDLMWTLDKAEGPGNSNLDQWHARVLSCEAMLLGAHRVGLAVDETDVPARVLAVREAYELE